LFTTIIQDYDDVAVLLKTNSPWISKREENKLICMTYDFKPVFTYNHEQLGGISGITTDEEGNIYIAGFASNNVHQITPDGKTCMQ
jgi:hypothetical protein